MNHGRAWVDSFQAGEPAVFKELVLRESPRLLGYAFRLTGDRASAEDLMQEVWMQAYRARLSYSGQGPVVAWLLAICRRLAATRARRERRQMTLAARLGEEVASERERTGSEQMESDVGAKAIAAVADLPEQQRNVLYCRVVEELSTRETAMRLGIAEGTVKATLYHALRALRNLIGAPT